MQGAVEQQQRLPTSGWVCQLTDGIEADATHEI